MKRSNTETHKFDYLKALHIIFFATMMISCLLNNSLAQADSLIPSDYRLATAGDKFSDTVQFAVAFKFRPPRRLRAKRMELVVGTIATSQESRLFVSLGPVWQLPIVNRSGPAQLWPIREAKKCRCVDKCSKPHDRPVDGLIGCASI